MKFCSSKLHLKVLGWNNVFLIIVIGLALMLLQFGCSRFKPMSVGFQECDLFFSVHDSCKGVPEKLKMTMSFSSDHAGVSFAKDNVTFTQDDFSETDFHGCQHTTEIRIPYKISPSGAQFFAWKIHKEGELWVSYQVMIHECNDASVKIAGSMSGNTSLNGTLTRELSDKNIILDGMGLRAETPPELSKPEIEKTPPREEPKPDYLQKGMDLVQNENLSSESSTPKNKIKSKSSDREEPTSESVLRLRGNYGFGSFSESSSNLFGYQFFWENIGIGQSFWDFKYMSTIFNLQLNSISMNLNYRFEIPPSLLTERLGAIGNDLTLGLGMVTSGYSKMPYSGKIFETTQVSGFDLGILFGQQQQTWEWLFGTTFHRRTLTEMKASNSTVIYDRSPSWLSIMIGAGLIF